MARRFRRSASAIVGCYRRPCSLVDEPARQSLRPQPISLELGYGRHVQAMVFSAHWAIRSATGVAFTRIPSTCAMSSMASSWSCGRARCSSRHPHAAKHHRGGKARGRSSDKPSAWKL